MLNIKDIHAGVFSLPIWFPKNATVQVIHLILLCFGVLREQVLSLLLSDRCFLLYILIKEFL
jgi:hypothetical protein